MCEKISLIEISATIERILMMTIESGGEVTPESFDELKLFRGKLERKGESIAFVIKGVIEGRIDRLKAMKEQVCTKLKAEENARDRLRTYLKEAMVATDTKKIKGDLYSITLRDPSKIIEVIDDKKTPAKYITVETIQKIDSRAILADLKAGIDVPGYKLADGDYSIMIK